MSPGTIQALRGPQPRLKTHLLGRPLGLVALAMVAVEAALGTAGASLPLLSAAALLAPGLALIPLLPEAARTSWGASLAAAPALGAAATGVLLVTLASAGVTLEPGTVRAALLIAVAAGLALPRAEPPPRLASGEAMAICGLLGAIVVGVALQQRVIAGHPVPGADWASYLLYADEVRAQGSLLIDNPVWMLGGHLFAQDPAVPALYGAFLDMTDLPTAVVQHGIWVFALMGTLSVFAFVRPLWGAAAGVSAAVLWSVLPINHDLIGWHGLANTAALAVLPLVLLYLATLLREGLSWLEASGLGLLLVSVAAFHRLSLLVCAGVVALSLAVGLVASDRRAVLSGAARAGLVALLLCPGVAYDTLRRRDDFGGLQDHTAYLTSKLDLDLLVRDLTVAFTVAAGAALVWVLVRRGRDRALVPVLATLVVLGAVAYSWLVDFPVAYVRMAYFVPLAAVPVVAAGAFTALPHRLSAGLMVVLLAVMLPFAWNQARDVRAFYEFANETSLRGADLVASRIRPGEAVATDRCWGFLAAWLVHAPTLAGLHPPDILPLNEVVPARRARAIVRGGPAGRRIAARNDVRFLMVDPGCTDARGRLPEPPRIGTPVFASDRLVVLELAAAGPR